MSDSSPAKRAAPDSDASPAKRSRPASDDPSSLDGWLSIPPPPPLAEPHAVSHPIYDKDSVFIGYAVPVPAARTKSSIDMIIARLPHDHHMLPDVIAGRPPKQGSGSTARKKIKPNHNMWAYRSMVLGKGKTGTLDSDWEVTEGSFDDDERWGGEHLLKVLREEGSTDVLVVCSRWFGGTMLGPARFQHIEDVGRAALKEYDVKERCVALWTELESLDDMIEEYRDELETGRSKTIKPSVRLLTDPSKLERLIKARSMTIKVLLDKIAAKDNAT